jgi:hypothetical protein
VSVYKNVYMSLCLYVSCANGLSQQCSVAEDARDEAGVRCICIYICVCTCMFYIISRVN